MSDVDTILGELLDELEAGGSPSIERYVERYPEFRDELLDFWAVLQTSPPPTGARRPVVDSADLSPLERKSMRDLMLAASLGPEMLERSRDEAADNAGEIGTELERLRAAQYAFRGKAPLPFRRIAVYAWIAGVLSETEGGGVSRLRVQKVAYLLEHGLSLGLFKRHDRHRFGPYDPSLTYRDAEPGGIRAGYLTTSEGGQLRPGPKLATAMGYARRYLRDESVARALAVRLSQLDERALETLATVHAVAVTLGRPAGVETVVEAIALDPSWRGKLRRGNFTAARIGEALHLLALLRMT